ncbi:MAG: hypothetical protein GEU82_10745 [Luteitalea sp.]|nr:hypothetical protein [Luteitalea sp.]
MGTPDREGTGAVTAGHFIFIPAVLLVGLVIGWILGSRSARDAFAIELKRREERAARKAGEPGRAGGAVR